MANFQFSPPANLNGDKNDSIVWLFLMLEKLSDKNGSNPDSGTSDFTGAVTLKEIYPLIYRRLFHIVSLWKNIFMGPMASCDGPRCCNSLFCHYVTLASKPGTFFWGLGMKSGTFVC